MEYILELKELRKSFDGVEVIKGINLSIKKGEFITILGPSGCGKTTTLRIISGMEEPDSGQVILEGNDVTNLVPNQRNVHTVFQSYALFPHMNVFDNVAYSQKLKHVPKDKRKELVTEALRFVRLEGYEKRLPSQLSGGQSQRVAIARAVINEPKVLLLDEPLGALDLRLRQQMQGELKHMQEELGITFVYITHDQEEALNMSDRIVVMKEGRFEQMGTPVEVYNHPRTAFVADFIGGSNIITGNVIDESNGMITFKNENGIGKVVNTTDRSYLNTDIQVAIRGENLSWFDKEEHIEPYYKGVVVEKVFQGGTMKIAVKLKDGKVVYSHQHDIMCPIEVGEEVEVNWSPEKAVLLEKAEKAEKEGGIE